MSGIYLHVPFCRAACHYCDFHFSSTLKNVEDYVTAVVKEVSLRKGDWEGVEFRTLYWGGGTPSVLKGEQCSRIVGALRESLNIRENIKEATIEVNPEDVTLKALKNWVECGFDRISIGIQSFDDHQLSWMNRKHTAAEAESAVMLARGAGFKKVSVDLIYGLPVRSENSWQETVKKALSLPIDHISCYALTVEPKTVLGARVKSGKEVEAPDELIEADYSHLCREAKEAGFIHYEVSNWARGTENIAIHNSAYWEGVPYLGLGPGAHGFKGMLRYANVSNNNKYIQSIAKDEIPEEIEELTRLDRSNEVLMTGLRTAKGVDFEGLKSKFQVDHLSENREAWKRLVSNGAVVQVGNRWRVSEKYWLVGDSIASDLISLQP